MFLLLLVIDGGQLLGGVTGLAGLQSVLYFEHLLVEVGGLSSGPPSLETIGTKAAS